MRHADWERSAALLRNLVAMRDRIRVLERTLKALAQGQEQAQD
jgi:UDP-3-O-[3-hydroxymyristoyl] glucosamine N-acyltransferase